LYEDIENALFKWFISARDQNVPVSGPILSSKAEQIANYLGYNDFRCSNGFIENFKSRRGKTVCCESTAVNKETANNWIENKLPNLISNYDPQKKVCNADETGLFSKCEPDKTRDVNTYLQKTVYANIWDDKSHHGQLLFSNRYNCIDI